MHVGHIVCNKCYLIVKMEFNNNFIKKSPKLKTAVVENILELLYQKDFTISELLFELQRRLNYSPSSSYKILKKYLVYLVDYELILYDGQRQVYTIEYNGLDLLNWISKEKNNLMENTEDITITIEREGGF
jgi:predicted transcriptional regulator